MHGPVSETKAPGPSRLQFTCRGSGGGLVELWGSSPFRNIVLSFVRYSVQGVSKINGL
jgi:hypothetical protein